MKRKLAALLIASLPLLSYGDHVNGTPGLIGGSALQTSQALAQTLNLISSEAQQVSQQASFNGNVIRAQRFQDLSYRSNQLSREVRQAIVRPLQMGEPIRRVAYNFENLKFEFQNLERSIQVIVQMPISIQYKIDSERRLRQQLRTQLLGVGPGPGGMFECRAADQGFEEHSTAHLGYGRSVVEAQSIALQVCQAVHGRCRIVSCVQR